MSGTLSVVSDLKRLGQIGAFVPNLSRFTIQETKALAGALESFGFRTLSFGETLGREAFTQAAVLLSCTRELVIMTGIAGIYWRDPWTMVNGARTLLEAYPGRFVLGVGVSHPEYVKRRGHTYERPVPAMRAYLETMKGAPWEVVLRTTSEKKPPAPPSPPVVLAALRPGMLKLVRDCADGANPYFSPVMHTELARKIIGSERWLCPVVTFILAPNRSEARSRGQHQMGIFGRLPNYRSNLLTLGWPAEELEDFGSDRLFDALIAWGRPADARARVNEHIAAGADHVQVEVLADTFSDLLTGYRALASDLL